jgi:pyruvate carboxylase subunit B
MKPVAHADLKTFRVDCQTYHTKLTKKFENREVWEKPDPREVYAYIPGSVVSVLVKEGDNVSAGAGLLTFEAMKMMCTLTMPYDGVVTKIHVKAGDRIRKSRVLVEITGAGGAALVESSGGPTPVSSALPPGVGMQPPIGELLAS